MNSPIPSKSAKAPALPKKAAQPVPEAEQKGLKRLKDGLEKVPGAYPTVLEVLKWGKEKGLKVYFLEKESSGLIFVHKYVGDEVDGLIAFRLDPRNRLEVDLSNLQKQLNWSDPKKLEEYARLLEASRCFTVDYRKPSKLACRIEYIGKNREAFKGFTHAIEWFMAENVKFRESQPEELAFLNLEAKE